MSYRAIVDRKGEPFGYLLGDDVYTLDDEMTGRIDGDYVVDLAGKPVWRLVGDGIYTLSGMEPLAFIGQPAPPDL
jgi:hypothetical protein